MLQNSETMSLSGEAAGEHKLPSNGSVVIQPAASAKPRANQSPSSRKSDTIPPYKMYALPAPIRTFPLPSFYPNNPLSLFHLVYAWLSQTFFPPPAEPSVVHEGTWDPDTRSVHIKDAKSIRALWQQGFFGKGSLSRSEPNWLKREISRRGDAERGVVAEQRTDARREERRMAKWERAKNELEAIERVKHEEAQSKETTAEELANGHVESPEPPSAQIDVPESLDPAVDGITNGHTESAEPPVLNGDHSNAEPVVDAVTNDHPEDPKPSVGPVELAALPDSVAKLVSQSSPAVAGIELSPAVPDSSSPESSSPVQPEPTLTKGIANGSVESPEPAFTNGRLDSLQPSAVDVTDGLLETPTSPITGARPENPKSPVGPVELLALPNSLAELTSRLGPVKDGFESSPNLFPAESQPVHSQPTVAAADDTTDGMDESTQTQTTEDLQSPKPPVGPAELLALPNSLAGLPSGSSHMQEGTERSLASSDPSSTELQFTESQPTESQAFELQPAAPNGITTSSFKSPKPPVGPLELLALPNSVADLTLRPGPVKDVIEMDLPCPDLSLTEAPPLQSRSAIADDIPNGHLETRKPPVGPLELLALPNSLADLSSETSFAKDESEQSQARPEPSLPESQPPAVNGITNGSIEGPKPPVGPLELLALPNSLPFCPQPTAADDTTESPKTPVSPLEPLSLPTSLTDLTAGSSLTQEEPELSPTDVESPQTEPQPIPTQANGHANDKLVNGEHVLDGHANGVYGILNGTCSASTPLSSAQGSTKKPQTNGQVAQPLKRRKGVRFSPEVESTTFQHTDPPSPNRSPPTATLSQGTVAERSATEAKPSTAGDTLPSSLDISVVFGELVNKEHFQLSPEEAFFLVFSLGALKIVDPVTKATIPTEQLLALFRSHSYFPARTADGSLTAGLQPHDPFLVHFAVYHHFRSLGWVPRHGIKFGVDWLLYQRGPVFDHAEFGLMVVPSFSDARWSEYEHEKAKRSWSWLMGVNRVLSHVLKGLVLVYVDVPPPPVFDEAMASGGIADALRKYTIREVMVRRWSSNRNR